MNNETTRRTGTVVTTNKDRGYFFILYEGRRVFSHASQWSELGLPSVNDVVSFEVVPAKKPQYQFEAINVRPIQMTRDTLAALNGANATQKGGGAGTE